MSLTTNNTSYWKFDESSGNPVDSLGAISLTNNGTTPYESAKINNGITTNGSSRYMSVASTAGLDISATGASSYSCWIKATSFVSDDITPIIGILNSGANNRKFRLGVRDSSGTKSLAFQVVATGATTYDAAYSFGTDTWYHIVWTISGNTILGYVNGSQVLSATNTRAGTHGSGPAFTIGKDAFDGAYFTGQIDEVGIWTRAITQAEVTALYNGGVGLTYPFGTANLKTYNTNAKSNIKTINTNGIQNIKTLNTNA